MSKLFSTIFLLALVLVATPVAYATWTPPAALPPACAAGSPGCDAPINVSANAQTKTGNLSILGALGIGTNPATKLHIFGVNPEFRIQDSTGVTPTSPNVHAWSFFSWSDGNFYITDRDTPNGDRLMIDSVSGNVKLGLWGDTRMGLELGGAIGGKTPNAGQIGYGKSNPAWNTNPSTSALDIYGGSTGTTLGNRVVKIWDKLQVCNPITNICVDVVGGGSGSNYWTSADSGATIKNTNTGNVGIGTGTANPTFGNLQIGNPSTAGQRSIALVDNGWGLKLIGGGGSFNGLQAIGTNVGLNFAPTVGGVPTERARLTSAGDLEIGFSPTRPHGALSLGTAVAGKANNAGKIGYNLFDPASFGQGVDFIGGGNAVGSRLVRVWDKLQVCDASGCKDVATTGGSSATNYWTLESDGRTIKNGANNTIGRVRIYSGLGFEPTAAGSSLELGFSDGGLPGISAPSGIITSVTRGSSGNTLRPTIYNSSVHNFQVDGAPKLRVDAATVDLNNPTTVTGQLTVNGKIKIVDAIDFNRNGKVLTSDANGLASWTKILPDPGANGNVLTANNGAWVSQAPGSTGGNYVQGGHYGYAKTAGDGYGCSEATLPGFCNFTGRFACLPPASSGLSASDFTPKVTGTEETITVVGTASACSGSNKADGTVQQIGSNQYLCTTYTKKYYTCVKN